MNKKSDFSSETVISDAVGVLEIEAQGLQFIKAKLLNDLKMRESFSKAVELLVRCQGKVIVAGMGKSGQVGRKIASTLASTGTPAMFLHPAESSHGDLGVISSQDVILALSYGGETPELGDLLKYVARKDLALIALTGKPDSTLGRAGRVCLDAGVQTEACPMGLAPTASSTATLALGDALAVAVLNQKGFKREDYAELHPGGSLGRRLLTRVEDVMHAGEAVPLVDLNAPMRSVISTMTQKEVRGVAGVIDQKGSGELKGIITDGDIRRRLEKGEDLLNLIASQVMSKNPKTVDASELAEKALFTMEQFRIQTLFVVKKSENQPDSTGVYLPVGVLHLQDLLKAGLR